MLAADFPPVDRAEWTALAGDVDALTHHSYDGIAIAALYDAGDAVAPDRIGWPGAPPFVRGGSGAGEGWDVRQRVTDSSGDAVGELERGSTSLLVDLPRRADDRRRRARPGARRSAARRRRRGARRRLAVGRRGDGADGAVGTRAVSTRSRAPVASAPTPSAPGCPTDPASTSTPASPRSPRGPHGSPWRRRYAWPRSTAPASTTPAPPTPRSSASRIAAGVAYLRGRSTSAGVDAGRRARPLRAAPRRHRRPVRHDRQVPRRPPAAGPASPRSPASPARPATRRSTPSRHGR